MTHRQPHLCGLLVVLLLSTSLLPDRSVAEEGIERGGTIEVATFQASAFTYQVGGALLWLVGPDGTVRLEILRSEGPQSSPDIIENLLSQQGQGWTAILAEHGDSTLNAWGQEWRRPPSGLAGAATVARAALMAGPPLRPRCVGPWRAARCSSPVARHRVAALDLASAEQDAKGGLRQTLTERGWGRGGSDDVLELRWVGQQDLEAPLLRIGATRRPGQLDLLLVESLPVVYASPEAFVPLWPLAQLLTFSD